jgi:DNA-binding transcriptional regulator YiaG
MKMRLSMANKSLLPNQISELRQAYINQSTRDLEELFFCEHSTIWKYCKDIKVKRKSKMKIPDFRIKQIRDMNRLGVFGTEIARCLGLSKYTVYNYLRG